MKRLLCLLSVLDTLHGKRSQSLLAELGVHQGNLQ